MLLQQRINIVEQFGVAAAESGQARGALAGGQVADGIENVFDFRPADFIFHTDV